MKTEVLWNHLRSSMIQYQSHLCRIGQIFKPLQIISLKENYNQMVYCIDFLCTFVLISSTLWWSALSARYQKQNLLISCLDKENRSPVKSPRRDKNEKSPTTLCQETKLNFSNRKLSYVNGKWIIFYKNSLSKCCFVDVWKKESISYANISISIFDKIWRNHYLFLENGNHIQFFNDLML